MTFAPGGPPSVGKFDISVGNLTWGPRVAKNLTAKNLALRCEENAPLDEGADADGAGEDSDWRRGAKEAAALGR